MRLLRPLLVFRLLIAPAAKFEMEIRQFDVTTAYLNGVVKEEILMEVPGLLMEG